MDKRIVAFLMGTRHMRVTAAVDPAVIAVIVSHVRTMPRIVCFRPIADRCKMAGINWGERVVRFEMRYRPGQRPHYKTSFMRFIVNTDRSSREHDFKHAPIRQWCDADGTAHIVGVVTHDGRFRVEARSTARPGTVLGYVETVPHTESVLIWLNTAQSPPFGLLTISSGRGTRDTYYRYLEVADDLDAKFEISPV